jgi:hypothetical protein
MTLTRRLAAAFAGAAVLLAAGAAAAFIPPPQRITTVSDDFEVLALNRAFLAVLETHGALGVQDSDYALAQFKGCLGKADAEMDVCVRRQFSLSARPIEGRAPPVVVMLSRVGKPGGHVFVWRCIGTGKASPGAPARSVTLDLQKGLFGPAKARDAVRIAAVRCVRAAAEETPSGG